MIAWNDGSVFREVKIPDDFEKHDDETARKALEQLKKGSGKSEEMKVESEDYCGYCLPDEEPIEPADMLNDEVQDIVLFHTHIAGTTHKDLDEIAPMLCVGDQLQLAHDRHNDYDPFAVMLLHVSGYNLGFLPREKNEIPARLLHADKVLFARIEKKRYIRNWLKISIAVYLRDQLAG